MVALKLIFLALSTSICFKSRGGDDPALIALRNFFNVFFSLGILIGLLTRAGAADPPKSDRAVFEDLTSQIYSEVIPGFYSAIPFPNSDEARAMRVRIQKLEKELAALPNPPVLPTIACAERDRLRAFLKIAEARFYGVLSESPNNAFGVDYKRERLELATTALKNIQSAQDWLKRAVEPTDPDFSPALKREIEQSEVYDYLNALTTTAYSIIWVVEKNEASKAAAAKAWSNISGDFRKKTYPPAPEVVAALDFEPDPPPNGAMTPIAWTGIGLIVLGLFVAIFVSKASLFQQWAIRVVFAIGAAMAATVITGLLNINIPQWGVVAGGALAIIVLIYLTNPPKIE